VPYRNSPQSISDVAAGHVALAFAEAGVSLPLIEAGKLRAIAVSSSSRIPKLPNIPPFAEAAGASDFEAVSWHMLLAPAGTPKDIVDRLHIEMKRIMAMPDIQQKTSAVGLLPVDSPSVEGMQGYIKSEGEKWGGLVRKLGLQGTL
jgi:tripartite-type tricarboxylate transporter receptor subunit TctC